MKLKKLLSFLLVITLLLFPLAMSADAAYPKEETIYANLSNDGSVAGLYVVNSFSLSENGTIVDYGNYESVLNLTNNETILFADGKAEVAAQKGVFYYQGNMGAAELPWTISIEYYLDGGKIDSSELAGKSGLLETSIEISQNPDADPVFYDSFTLQMTVLLDSGLCSAIEAPGATLASAGGDKQLTYTVLPGSGGDYTFSAEVTNFELAPMTIACIKSEISFDTDSLDLSGVMGDFSQLEDGVAQLDDGVSDITGGAGDLSAGLDDYASGINEYIAGVGELASGAQSLSSGAADLESGLSELSKQGESLAYGAKTLLDTTFDGINAGLAADFSALNLEAPVLTAGNYADVIAALGSSYPPMAESLAQMQQQLDLAISFYHGVLEYTGGVDEVYAGSKTLAQGSAALSEGLSRLHLSGNSLSGGAAQFSAGMRTLAEGLKTLSLGSGELRTATSGIEETVSSEVDSLLSGFTDRYSDDFKAVSFVSEDNTNIDLVQFILKTEGISISAPKAVPEAAPEKLNLWQRLLKLFGLYS